MTDQTTATLPATDQATFSRTGLLFGALCLVALIAPLVHVKPNRILAGEGLALPLALNAPIGWVISATLLALTAATLSRRRRAMQLVGLALIGLGLTILSLGPLSGFASILAVDEPVAIGPDFNFWCRCILAFFNQDGGVIRKADNGVAVCILAGFDDGDGLAILALVDLDNTAIGEGHQGIAVWVLTGRDNGQGLGILAFLHSYLAIV